MNDERFQKLQELDPTGFPSLNEVTKEVMRGPDVRGAVVSDEVGRTYTGVMDPNGCEVFIDSMINAGGSARLEAVRPYADEPQPGWQDLTLDSCAFVAAPLDENCQSGSSDMVRERRQRDRSGNKPKVRKWKNREKAKAARKARRAQR